MSRDTKYDLFVIISIALIFRKKSLVENFVEKICWKLDWKW